jgi:cytochrome c-type biogenesis protein CcmH/NrfG
MAPENETVAKPTVPPKKTNWAVIVGAVILVLLLGLGGLAVAGRMLQNARLRATATALAQVTPALPTADTVGLAQTAVAVNPNDIDAHLKLGDAYHQAGRVDDALGEYTKAAELAGYTPQFYAEHIVPRLGEEDPIMALTLVAEGLRHNETPLMWGVATPLIERVSQHPDGGPVLESLAHDHPDRPAVTAALARYYIIHQQLDKAQPIVDGLRRDHPDEAVTHFVYAEYLAASGDKAGAIVELQLILDNRRAPLELRRLAERRINELKGTPSP